jgi:hypothetical protein
MIEITCGLIIIVVIFLHFVLKKTDEPQTITFDKKTGIYVIKIKE